MKKTIRLLITLILATAMLFSFAACGMDPGNGENNDPVIDDPGNDKPNPQDSEDERIGKYDENGDVCEDGWYYSAEDVTEYILNFGKVPSNFVSKSKAKEAGWKDGSVEKYIKGAAIGGVEYSNNEKLLPTAAGRQYYYCDIDTHNQNSRGSKRLVYSNDGLFYYTEDSFKSFILFYGEAEDPNDDPDADPEDPSGEITVKENGKYYDKDHVALYIHTYGKLPSNYVTKAQAKKKGWNGGSIEKYIEGAAIGGSSFGNNEGLLPNKKGRQYYECDIDTLGEKTRGAKRIIFSNDGLVYYTDDHYGSFTKLYGEE